MTRGRPSFGDALPAAEKETTQQYGSLAASELLNEMHLRAAETESSAEGALPAQAKRLKVEETSAVPGGAVASTGSSAMPSSLPWMSSSAGSALFCLPVEVLDLVLSFLDSVSLSKLSLCSKAFSVKERGLSIVEKAARDQLTRCVGHDLAIRWR